MNVLQDYQIPVGVVTLPVQVYYDSLVAYLDEAPDRMAELQAVVDAQASSEDEVRIAQRDRDFIQYGIPRMESRLNETGHMMKSGNVQITTLLAWLLDIDPVSYPPLYVVPI